MFAGILFTLMGLAIPFMLIINFTVSNASRELLVSLLGDSGADLLRLYLVISKHLLRNAIHSTLVFCSNLVTCSPILGFDSRGISFNYTYGTYWVICVASWPGSLVDTSQVNLVAWPKATIGGSS